MNGFDTLKIFINEMKKLQQVRLVIEEKYAPPVITNEDIVKIKKAYEVTISGDRSARGAVSPEMIYEMIVGK
ncbi:MAG: hypothetical protein ABIF11_01345 [Nitrospirota bacterium]